MSFDLPSLPSGWTYASLETCARKQSISYGVVQPGAALEAGVPIIRVNNFKDGRIDIDDLMKISPEIESKYARTRLIGGEVLITLVGSVGQVAVAPKTVSGFNVARAVAVIHPEEHVSPNWIAICLRSPLSQHLLVSRANTTVQTTINLKDLRALPLPLPPIEEREQIENFITALDDRIALLRETSATLEAIAQALFKSWFVDFDPVHANAAALENKGQAPSLPPEIQALFPATFTDSPKGPIPEGWSYVNLGELVCNQSTTFRFQGIDKVVFINTGDVSEGLFLHQDYVSTDGLPGQAKKAIQRDDILFSEIRPKNKRFAYVNLDPKDYVVSTKFMVLRAISDVSPRYIYQILKQDETIEFFNMIAESRSGTFPQITFDSIQTYQVLKPSKACVDKFIDLVSPIIEQIDLTSERQKELSILRDTLLPRLISGQLRLPEAEKAIAAITD